MPQPHENHYILALAPCYGKCNIAHFWQRASDLRGLGTKNCRFVTPKLPPISGLERCQQAGSSSE